MTTAKKAPAKKRGVNFRDGSKKHIVVPVITAVGQSDKVAFAAVLGYAFRVVGVQIFCSAVTVVVSAVVKIDDTEVCTETDFVADTRTDCAVNAAAGKGGGKDAELSVEYTSDGDGALTNGFVVITVEPRT